MAEKSQKKEGTSLDFVRIPCMMDLRWKAKGLPEKEKEDTKMFSLIQPPTQPFTTVQPEPQEWYYIPGSGFETA